jgi:uncharacterized protein YgbK (DUF1537 family)
MKWAGILLPAILAVIGFKWIPLSTWIDMNQGLLAFLGLLAAALIQVIPVTANFIQSDQLTPIEAEHLSKQLSKQQRYWIGLFASTIATVVIVVIVSVLKDLKPLEIPRYGYLDISSVLSGAISAAMMFLVVKMAGLFQGVTSLQKLRNELVIAAAKRNAAEKVEKVQREVILPQNLVLDSYGQIIRPH